MNNTFEKEHGPIQLSRRDVLRATLASAAVFLLDACDRGAESPESNGEFSKDPAWEQDFSKMPDGPIDTSVWRYELDPEVPTYNDEAQAFTNKEKNVRIQKGKLILEAHREAYSYPKDRSGREYEFTSGRIDTKDTFSFEYGKFEVSMKLAEGSGTWPAFWFLSANQPFTDELNPTEKDWAKPRFYMHNGELDGVETYGNKPGVIEGTLHTFKKSTEFDVTVPDASEVFHTYGVEVTPTKVVWTLDGKPFGTLIKPSDDSDDWPFGKGNRMYPILNLAMGGVSGDVDSDKDSWRMEVQHARYFEYNTNE